MPLSPPKFAQLVQRDVQRVLHSSRPDSIQPTPLATPVCSCRVCLASRLARRSSILLKAAHSHRYASLRHIPSISSRRQCEHRHPLTYTQTIQKTWRRIPLPRLPSPIRHIGRGQATMGHPVRSGRRQMGRRHCHHSWRGNG